MATLDDFRTINQFQSTHPVRGATFTADEVARFAEISIHAPREGCDTTQDNTTKEAQYFNPRTP